MQRPAELPATAGPAPVDEALAAECPVRLREVWAAARARRKALRAEVRRFTGRQRRKRLLWLGGADSDYIRDEDVPGMRALFPRVVRVTVRDASHWVHADQPEAFVTALRTFLTAD